MVKKFSIPCNFGGQVTDVDFFVGIPHSDVHPINFQSKWLGENRGGTVPKQVMDSLDKIRKIAEKEKISFEDLCQYTINLANSIPQDENTYYNKLLIESDSANKKNDSNKTIDK
jgi:hypothetical protein